MYKLYYLWWNLVRLINDLVNAAYGNYQNKFLGIGYQAGMRFEQTFYQGILKTTGQSFEYNYPSTLSSITK